MAQRVRQENGRMKAELSLDDGVMHARVQLSLSAVVHSKGLMARLTLITAVWMCITFMYYGFFIASGSLADNAVVRLLFLPFFLHSPLSSF